MQQWVKKKEKSIGVPIRQSASREKKSVSRSRHNPGSGELTITLASCPGTATGTVIHHHLRPELVHHSLGRVLHYTDWGGYQPKTPPEAQTESQAQAQAQAAKSKER